MPTSSTTAGRSKTGRPKTRVRPADLAAQLRARGLRITTADRLPVPAAKRTK